jgi:hypothetical protein
VLRGCCEVVLLHCIITHVLAVLRDGWVNDSAWRQEAVSGELPGCGRRTTAARADLRSRCRLTRQIDNGANQEVCFLAAVRLCCCTVLCYCFIFSFLMLRDEVQRLSVAAKLLGT